MGPGLLGRGRWKAGMPAGRVSLIGAAERYTACLPSPVSPSRPVYDGPPMQFIHTADDPRIATLLEMLRDLSRCDDPQQVLGILSRGIVALGGERGYISLSTRGLEPGQYRITRQYRSFAEAAAAEQAQNPWGNRDRLPVHEGGLIGRIIATSQPIVVDELDVKDDPVLGDFLSPFGALLAIPLFDEGEPLNWAVMLFESDHYEMGRALEDAVMRANLVGSTVKQRLLIRQLSQANAHIRREMHRIADIQRALLPSQLPQVPGLALAASYETFDEAGGDMYDVVPLGDPSPVKDDPAASMDGRWAIMIGDVSGHGPSAAVMMAMLHAILRAYPSRPETPGQLLEHANVHLAVKNIEQTFITVFLAFYEPATGELVYARAGHPPPLVMGPEPGAIATLNEVGDIPLGIFDRVRYASARCRIEPGQTVTFYTDGITEARNIEGTMFDVAGLIDSLHDCTGEPHCVISHVRDHLKRFEAGRRPKDDQTLLAMQVLNRPQPTEATCVSATFPETAENTSSPIPTPRGHGTTTCSTNSTLPT